nr:Rieske 2Fe-2S domain-containing protein [Granulosicoccus sp.]
ALRDQCPHEAGPLSEGIVHGNCVTCPLHNWVISLESGEAQGADHGSTQTYPVRTEGDQLLLNTDEHGSATAADDMPQKEPSTAVS